MLINLCFLSESCFVFMGSTCFFVERSYFRDVVEFKKGKFDSQQYLMGEAPKIAHGRKDLIE